MAIVLENGVTLPDIPADMLAKYPYAFIMRTMLEDAELGRAENFSLQASSSEMFYLPTSLTGDTVDYVANNDIGVWAFLTESNEWGDITEVAAGDGQYMHFDGKNFYSVIVWSNHDICELTGVDPDTGDYTTGDIFFLDSTVTFEGKYLVPGTWFKNLSDVVRSITGVVKRYTTDEMQTALKAAAERGPTTMTLGKFTYSSSDEIYGCTLTNACIAELEDGKTYRVIWDGVAYECVASFSNSTGLIGNLAVTSSDLAGTEGDTGEPFLITCGVTDIACISIIYTKETDEFHTISIAAMS